MKKKTISSMLAVCMCTTMFAGMGVSTASAEDVTADRTIFSEDFDGTNYTNNTTEPSSTYFAFSEAYNAKTVSDNTIGVGVQWNLEKYNYGVSNANQGDLLGYGNGLLNIKYSTTYNALKWSRAVKMVPDTSKETWYADVKLSACDPSYNEITVAELAKKTLDVSAVLAYNNGMSDNGKTDTNVANPGKVQVVFTVNGQEKVCDLSNYKISTANNDFFTTGIHVRNSLKSVLSEANAADTATDVRVRIGGTMATDIKRIYFDNFLIKEVGNSKELYSEDFEERAWVTKSNTATKLSIVDGVPGTSMTGNVLKVESASTDFGHEQIFRMPNADRTKCYKVSLDMYYPTSNTAPNPEVWVREEFGSATCIQQLGVVEKSDEVQKLEYTFDFSSEPPAIVNKDRLGLFIKFGTTGKNLGGALGESMYLDNIKVTEIPVRKINAIQGANWFTDDVNSLVNGDVKFVFRNTEENCRGFVAKYADDGSVVGVEVLDVATDKAYEKTVSVDDTVTKVSAFMWDGDSIKPIIGSVNVFKANTAE